jgi:hypothetical protein
VVRWKSCGSPVGEDEELDGPVVIAIRRAIAEGKQDQSLDGKFIISSFGRHVKPLVPAAPTNPHWARVVGYDPFSLCVIYKEGLCPSSGDMNKLMMIIMSR